MHMRQKNWDVADLHRQIRAIHTQVVNPFNDGFTGFGCKQDLFQLKCLIEDLYEDTPSFAGEEEWLQQRTIELLKKKPKPLDQV